MKNPQATGGEWITQQIEHFSDFGRMRELDTELRRLEQDAQTWKNPQAVEYAERYKKALESVRRSLLRKISQGGR
jgi:hypothetical protein